MKPEGDGKQLVFKLNSFSAAHSLLLLLLHLPLLPRCASPCRRRRRPRGAAMAKIRVSYEYSEAEDKSIRLGLFLIACGILSLFILGFCWLSPTLQSLQSKPANCTVSPAAEPPSRAAPLPVGGPALLGGGVMELMVF